MAFYLPRKRNFCLIKSCLAEDPPFPWFSAIRNFISPRGNILINELDAAHLLERIPKSCLAPDFLELPLLNSPYGW
jgi:hypothetical protein